MEFIHLQNIPSLKYTCAYIYIWWGGVRSGEGRPENPQGSIEQSPEAAFQRHGHTMFWFSARWEPPRPKDQGERAQVGLRAVEPCLATGGPRVTAGIYLPFIVSSDPGFRAPQGLVENRLKSSKEGVPNHPGVTSHPSPVPKLIPGGHCLAPGPLSFIL